MSNTGPIKPRKKVHPVIDELRAIRNSRKMSLAKLADKVGYDIGVFCSVERGRSRCRFEVLAAWAQALGYDIVLKPKDEEQKLYNF